MNTPSNESSQRNSDDQRRLYDERRSDYPPFRLHTIATPITLPNPALLGSRAQVDAFADDMLRREREYQEAMAGLPEQRLEPDDLDAMAQRDELQEGRVHATAFPVNFHD